jgi:DNA-binding PadR family transcriptional regulator
MTSAELAILSLITEQPCHGYEIEQVIEERGMREWTELGFSSIYYLLKKLESKSLIEGELKEAERGPARKVYRITPNGTQALHASVVEALSVPGRCYPPLLLGLSNLSGIPPAEALAALRHYHAALSQRLEKLRASWEERRPVPDFVDAMFDYSLTMIRAEMAWVAEFIEHLEQ